MDGTTGITPTYNLAEHGGYYDGFGGGSGIWLFAILALMWGGNGMFGRNNAYPTDYARQSDVVYTSAFNQLQEENMNIVNNTQRLATELQQAISTASYNDLAELKDLEASVGALSAKQQECCCSTLRAIDGVNYNGALNTAAIKEAIALDGQKTRDLITSNKLEALQQKVSSLELSQALTGVVRYPLQTTFTAGNPFFPNANPNI